VGVQEISGDKGGTVTGDIFFLCKGNENYQLGAEFFVNHRIITTFKRVEFVSYMATYM
jgi:hypothetical protein